MREIPVIGKKSSHCDSCGVWAVNIRGPLIRVGPGKLCAACFEKRLGLHPDGNRPSRRN